MAVALNMINDPMVFVGRGWACSQLGFGVRKFEYVVCL